MHTNRSDGSDPPVDVAARAAELGLAAIAVTDHDTVAGVIEAQEAAQAHGLGSLRGVEMSAQYQHRGIHIVGLGIDLDCEVLRQALETFRRARAQRADAIIEKLNGLGVPVQKDRVVARTHDGLIGRMHIAQEVLALGHAKTVQDAFDRYIRRGRPAFVPKTRIPAQDAIRIIHEAEGLAFLAHPGLGDLDKTIPDVFNLPFDGLEAYHSKHTAGQTTLYLQTAAERGWLVSGGSDCHGTAKHNKPEMGRVRVPYEHYQRIHEALSRR